MRPSDQERRTRPATKPAQVGKETMSPISKNLIMWTHEQAAKMLKQTESSYSGDLVASERQP